MGNILIIDDDIYTGDALEEALTKEGYRVSRAYSGTEALLVLDHTKPDLVLLDLMLPGLNGEEILPRIQGIPVIVVSAKVDIASKVNLLTGGASDYVTKPFHIRELLARISVQLRNTDALDHGRTLTFREITLDPDVRIAYAGQRSTKLTRTECAILKLLMQNPNQVITKSNILDRISRDTPDCTEASLKMHVSNLRKKLFQISDKDYIEAVWGIGFKMRTALVNKNWTRVHKKLVKKCAGLDRGSLGKRLAVLHRRQVSEGVCGTQLMEEDDVFINLFLNRPVTRHM